LLLGTVDDIVSDRLRYKPHQVNSEAAVVWCKVYFDILNRLGVTQECDRDRQTDGQSLRWSGFILRRAAKKSQSYL